MSRNGNRNELIPRGTAAAITGTLTVTGTAMVTVGVTGTATGTAAAAMPCCLICKQHGTTAGYSRLTLPPRRGKKKVAQGKRGTSATLGCMCQIALPLAPSDGERGRGEGSPVNPTPTATVTVATTTITNGNGIIPRAVHPTKWDTLNSPLSHQCGSTVEPHYSRKTAVQFELASISG
jgi:hypothetical protein